MGLGRLVLVGCALWAIYSLIRVWRESAGAPKPASTLVWATTITWTLLLNVYVPIYDSILIVISAIATAGTLKAVSERYYPWFTLLWVLTLATSWITIAVAAATGVQIATLMFIALGVLQLAAARQAVHGAALQPALGRVTQPEVAG